MKKILKQLSLPTLALLLLSVILGVGLDASAMTAIVVPTKSKDATATGAGTDGKGPGKVATNDGVGTTTWDNENNPDLLLSTVERKVVKIRPMGNPLETISRYASQRPTNNMKVEYGATSSLTDRSAVKKAITEVGNRINLLTENDNIFTSKEVVIFPEYDGYEEGEVCGMLHAAIVSKDKNGLDLICINGKLGADKMPQFPELKAGALILRSARAHNEKDIQTPAYNSTPTKEYNYCQIFRAQVEESTLKAMADKELDWELSDQEEEAIFDMKLGMSKAFMLGAKSVFRDDSEQDVYTTQGIYFQTKRSFVYGDAEDTQLTHDDLLNLSKSVFTGSNGNKIKVWLMGSELMNNISKIKHPQNFKDAGTTHVKWGITFKELTTNFGTLWLVLDEVFDTAAMSENGLVMDPRLLRKYILKSMTTVDLDLKTSGVSNVNARNISEISCLILQNKEAHTRVEPFKS